MLPVRELGSLPYCGCHITIVPKFGMEPCPSSGKPDLSERKFFRNKARVKRMLPVASRELADVCLKVKVELSLCSVEADGERGVLCTFYLGTGWM